MDWKKSATGHWVAFDGKNRYSIQSLVCFDAKNKACRRYRLRVNDSAVGGARPVLFDSVAQAKKHASDLTSKFYHGNIRL